MKRILAEYEFSEEQLNIICELAKSCGLCEETVKILYGRGLRTRSEINEFLHPSKDGFISPFKMQGMREAVELITLARDEEWTVVVYGDYDADGICATTIMSKVLRDFGIEPYICVPERRNGYGLSTGLIDEIFEEYCPELIITVDCGISGAEEVRYIQEQGAEVIVTDHHELPDNLPGCICINPKFNDGYIYDNLCGAGVAFKVGCALNGESAYKYLDFAAIATVADSVPLTGENRIIVAEGLKIINKKPSKCYAEFINKNDNVNSQSVAFSIAPKINAAGRMGDAHSALALFNSCDDGEIFDLSAKLISYNMERQKYCDELYASAKSMLAESDKIGKVIMLYNDQWNTGFVGIVAARLVEEYSRPVILFVRNGDMLKGSARSVDSINIFEALKACSEYVAEFGGHSQAAGVNVDISNFESLQNALNSFIAERYTAGDFMPTIYINGELKGNYSPRFAKEIELLEPFGVGNRRPVFMVKERAAEVRRVKAMSPHISVKSGKIELMCFGGAKYSRLFSSNAEKKYIFEYNVSQFRGKEYIKGFVRDFVYDAEEISRAREELFCGYIEALAHPVNQCKVQVANADTIENLIETCGEFGTLFIAYDYGTVQKYKGLQKFNCELFTLSGKNGASATVLSPDTDNDFNLYKRIIFLDDTCGIRLEIPDSVEIIKAENAETPAFVHKLNCDRIKLLEIFAMLSANSGNIQGENAAEVAVKNNFGCSRTQALFALKVFEQLSLIDFTNGRLEIFRGVKSRLENSELYNLILKLQG